MLFARTVDWLTFTSPEPPRWHGPVEKIKSPVRFYQTGLKYECGTIASYGNPNSDLWLVSMSSKAIEQRGMLTDDNARLFMGQRLEQGCKFSRVDLAITAQHDGELTIDTVRQWIRDGQLIAPQHRAGHVKSIIDETNSRGETIYMGEMKKRGRRGIARAYDKGLELGMEPGMLTRFEVEEKRDVAHRMARQYVEGEDIGALIGSRLQFDNETWSMLTGGEIAPEKRYKPEKRDEPIDKTWLWLIERVAPVLARKIAVDEEFGRGEYTRSFMKALTDGVHREKLTLNQES